MGYSAGMLKHRVAILNKKDADKIPFGAKAEYEQVACVHADMTFSKGVKSLREGALDAYDTVMFRMRWNNIVTRESLLEYEGVRYQIQSLHADKMDNIVQITATEMTTK